jgi:hypothetical protein
MLFFYLLFKTPYPLRRHDSEPCRLPLRAPEFGGIA